MRWDDEFGVFRGIGNAAVIYLGMAVLAIAMHW
jgi:hypothetical protein